MRKIQYLFITYICSFVLLVTQHHGKQISVPVCSQKAPSFEWPLCKDSFWISCYYGRRQRKRLHKGLDLASLRGTPMKASAPGKVLKAYIHPAYGKMILIAHNRYFETRYAHLDRILVKPGAIIEKGQLIGQVGKTGRVSGKNGEHLHFEILYKEHPIDPLRFLPRLT